MAEKTLKDAFYETLKDVYYAEKAGLRSIKKAVKAAKAPQLKEALAEHSEESQHQVERLVQVFELLGKPARTKTCEAMQGITSEMEEDLEDFGDSEASDEVLIGCAQAVEHYEMARYGLLQSWAKKLGMADAANLLGETLAEEKRADAKLTEIGAALSVPSLKTPVKAGSEADDQDGETMVKTKKK